MTLYQYITYGSKVYCIGMTLYQYITYLFMSFLLLRNIPLMKTFIYPIYFYLLYDYFYKNW